MRLSMEAEDIRYGQPRSLFDEGIKIEELPTKAAGQEPSHCAFTRSHEAGKNNAAQAYATSILQQATAAYNNAMGAYGAAQAASVLANNTQNNVNYASGIAGNALWSRCRGPESTPGLILVDTGVWRTRMS